MIRGLERRNRIRRMEARTLGSRKRVTAGQWLRVLPESAQRARCVSCKQLPRMTSLFRPRVMTAAKETPEGNAETSLHGIQEETVKDRVPKLVYGVAYIRLGYDDCKIQSKDTPSQLRRSLRVTKTLSGLDQQPLAARRCSIVETETVRGHPSVGVTGQ